MKYLAIDLGSYSIKTMLVHVERKSVTLLDTSEFVLNDLKAELDPEGDDLSLKRVLLENIIPDDFDGKVIYQLPNQMVTSRHLELPVTQKKKVDMMIPFQLDELLPYPSHEAHFFSQQKKNEHTTTALVNITKRQDFDEFFNYFEETKVLPTILTSELSTINSHVQNKNIRGPIAILDIGHRTSKCYIIYQGEVVSHHFSFCAGSTIDEVISETYQIPAKDAVTYKHQNCFLLTDGQYDEVNDDQREFALLMRKAFNPLVNELKRWLLGFRVKYGLPIDRIYLSGGSTNIHNINNFFTQQTGIQTDFTTLSESIIDSEELLTGKECTYNLSGLMAINTGNRFKPGNFLHGHYSTGSSLTLPLYSAAFVMQRALFASLVFSLILGIDIFFQGKKEKDLNRQLKGLLKQKELDVSATQKRRLNKYLPKITKKIEKKNKALEKEIKALKSGDSTNALGPLFDFFKVVKVNKDIELTVFKSNGKIASGKLLASNEKAVKNIKALLKRSTLPSLKVKNKGSLVSFSFGSEED